MLMDLPGSTAKALLQFARSNYRTYSLNDASIVSKAKFYIMSEELSNDRFQIKKILPVQFNPSTIQFNNEILHPPVMQGVGDPRDPRLRRIIRAAAASADRSPRNFSISLDYDIYDEYNAATMNGMLGAVESVSLSLENEAITSLYELRSRIPCHVLFVWGDIQIFGLLSSVNCSYNTFSPHGNPLSANATVDITEELLSDDPTTKPIDSGKFDAASKIAVNSDQKAESISTATLLTSSAAMR